MDWFAAGGLLIAVRGIHFAATAVVAGILVFQTVVAKPALSAEVARKWQTQSRRLAWIALVIALLSGVIWLLLQAISMSGLPPDEAMTSQVLWTVLNQTQFGVVTESRGVLAVILAGVPGVRPFSAWRTGSRSLRLSASPPRSPGPAMPPRHQANSATCISPPMRCISLPRQAWIGGLVPLALLLAAARRDDVAPSLASEATRRFSIVGHRCCRDAGG